ncbi:MAG: type I DNA topoisomerase [Deltaproteobacteria bacterium]|nr:type I DNA topoisomerase [Deltaproteobacteria bacterium]
MRTLVIVESPAKAKTIAGYLGKGFDVEASFGHVRDLPQRADEIPTADKKNKWAKLGVNVEASFEPLYVVPETKKRHVANLRAASKGIDQLLLATDEDREGESISWHVCELLKPPRSVKIGRIVFHEITPEAIQAAVRSPRAIDERLVRAQETRRILDRLFGYTLSPVLWKKVAPKLSAGRVQSVAVRMLVDRERERAAFKTAWYWDFAATVKPQGAANGSFGARLVTVGGQRVASGRNFDPTTGRLVDSDVLLLDEARATALAEAARASKSWRVERLESKGETERPPVPFMTSTLQQEANRKLRFSSKRTMQIAQGLYEGVDLGGERVGLITYMRTDSLTLAERAITQCRDVITKLYGPEYVPDAPVRYKTKSKNAQEAHEAIRPTDLSRTPESVRAFLDADQRALYELIWKRTIACQMNPARVRRTHVQLAVDVLDAASPQGAPQGAEGASSRTTLSLAASGKQIEFPGFLRAYVEGSDDPEAELAGREVILPQLEIGQALSCLSTEPAGHQTKPPPRLTEASLVKRLEEAGVGRPSTYASIITTIQERGYVFKKGNELVPTFTAYAVTDLLAAHFPEYVDVGFTAKMEDQLDEIAEGARDHVAHLKAFYLGEGDAQGLVAEVEKETPGIAFPAVPIGADPETGAQIVVRVGRFGTYVQRGEGGAGNTATLPEDTVPAELDVPRVLALLAKKGQGPRVIAKDEATGRDVTLRTGRFGSYIEVAQTEAEAASGEKPRRVSLPEGTAPDSIGAEEVATLLRFPRALGKHPKDGEDVTVQMGRFGAYVKWGKETRNVPDWRAAAALELGAAVALLDAPKIRGRRGAPAAPPAPLRELGVVEGRTIKVMDGRYGPYVSDGETHATLPKGSDPQDVTFDEAVEMLRARAASAPKKGFRRGAKRGGGAPKAKAASGGKAKGASRKSAKSSNGDSHAEKPKPDAKSAAGAKAVAPRSGGDDATPV